MGRNPLAAVTPASYDLFKTWLSVKARSCPMRPLLILGTTVLSAAFASTAFAQAPAAAPHNIVLFVADGLRALKVTPETAPAMAQVRDKGVNFRNSHSLFPTFTMANASGMATGHMLGDTGDFSNTIYAGFQVPGANNSSTPFLESDVVLGDVDEHFAGNYLDEATILKLARDKGYSTASIGKIGPVLIFDPTERSGEQTIIVDDATGTPKGIPLSADLTQRLQAANLPVAAPGRGANGNPGNMTTPGTTVANVVQQDYFAAVASKAVLPLFKDRNKPFVLVFWSRDPDGSQHNQGDSLNTLVPGINGPTSLAGIKNADDDLAALRKALDELGLAADTNILIASDHGFSTISKESKTSLAAKASYEDTPKDFLPMGFLALDLAKALDLPLFDPNDNNAKVADGAHPKAGNGLLGQDPSKPDLVVATNGGSDLIYLPKNDKGDKKLADRTVKALLDQDYVSGIFVDDKLGRFPGTLPLSQVNLKGKAVTPTPSIVVNFRSFAQGCGEPTNCSVEISDTVLRQGQGMHGSFGRGDTLNFMAAAGPDFKAGYVDGLPVNNADVGMTIAELMGLRPTNNGGLTGRVMSEALPNGIVL